MTVFSAMMEAETSIQRQRCFARQLVKVVVILSPGYASLPQPLQIVYAMVIVTTEGKFDVVIPAPNR